LRSSRVNLSGTWSNAVSVHSSTQFRASTMLLFLLAWKCKATHWSGFWQHDPYQVPWKSVSRYVEQSQLLLRVLGGSCAGGTGGSVPLLRKHSEVGPSHWLALQQAASASNKPPGEQPWTCPRPALAPVQVPRPFSHTCILIELLSCATTRTA
jgi:hypothetical protein